MNVIWWGLGMGVIGGALGLLGIAGWGIYMAGRGFERAVRETEAEDASRWWILCTVFPGVDTVKDCREKRMGYPGMCNDCAMRDRGIAEDGMHV